MCFTQVNGKCLGDFRAISSAKQAKIWGWISMGLVILGFVINLIYFIFALLAGGLSATESLYDDPYRNDAPQYENPYSY